MNHIRYGMKLFFISRDKNIWEHYFVFLAKLFFHSDNFSGTFSKKDFLQKGIEYNFSPRNLENIYAQGIKTQIFHTKHKNMIFLKSLFDKSIQKELMVYISEKNCKKILSINDFKSLCYMLGATMPYYGFVETSKKQMKNTFAYHDKNPSRSLSVLGELFGETQKDIMSKRLHKAQKLFPDIFKITHRYGIFPIQGKKYIVQVMNLYSLDGVEFKMMNKGKKHKKSETKMSDTKGFFHKTGRSGNTINKKHMIRSKTVKESTHFIGGYEKNIGFVPTGFYDGNLQDVVEYFFGG